MAKQEKRISYQAGITRRPSDFLCQDGELAECINLTTDNEELKPVVQPPLFIDIAKDSLNNSISLPTIIYAHRHSGCEMYIGYTKVGSNYNMEYGTRTVESGRTSGTYIRSGFLSIGGTVLSESTPPTGIASIGKTVIITYPSNVFYFLLDASTGEYKGMGSDVDDAEISMDFDLENSEQRATGQPASFSISGFIHHDFRNEDDVSKRYYIIYTEDNEEYEALKNALNGLVNARLKHVAEQKKFAFPFFVRYAIRLYDGTYTNISQPVLVFPTVRHNCDIFFANQDGTPQDTFVQTTDWDSQCINYKPVSAGLKVKVNFNSQTIDNWKDIIAGIDVFVSEPQMPFNLNSDWTIVNPFDEEHQGNMILFDYANTDSGSAFNTYKKQLITTTVEGQSAGYVPYFKPTHLTDAEIMHELSEKSLFYRIAQIDVNEFSSYSSPTSLDSKMTQSTLVNLVSQQRLQNDDYFSRTVMSAGIMKAYNERLHLADVKRTFFPGFDKFTTADYATPSPGSYTIVVYIKTDSGQRILTKQAIDLYKIMNIWFFYPDPRAERVEIYSDGWLRFNIPLTEHRGLNGAYFLDHLPTDNESLPAVVAKNPPSDVDDPEIIKNHLFVSVVDNPFSFISKGDVVVGQGDIIGVATQTETLGQEEHGIHPLVVFTKRGIVAMRIDDEGYYSRVDELNREICINKKSITETDGPVFFVSKKGLMMLNGKQALCVSEQMNGKTFNTATLPNLGAGIGTQGAATYDWATIITACQGTKTFLDFVRDASCFISYDYTDKRLLICNPNCNYVYAYGMEDHTVSKVVLPSVMEASVSDYPDNLLRAATGKQLYTLYGKPREDELSSRQRAFILTRPIKLGGPLAVSSLRELVNVGDWTAKDSQGHELSCVKTVVWLSDDMHTWHEMTSRFGAAARYFRIGLFINMLPVERLSGTIITEQERRTDNLRA